MMSLVRFPTGILPSRPPQRRSPGWRRRSVGVLLLAVLIGWGLYYRQTREDRLIAMADGFLAGMSGGQVEIRRARFSFFGGIHLTDVTVRTPPDAEFGPADSPARVVFRAADLHLRHRPLALLLGRFQVQQIIAIRPEFHIVHQTATGRSNWQAMLAAREVRPGGPMQMPSLRLQRCSVRTGALDGGRLSLAEPVEIELVAVPDARQPGLYACSLRPLGQDRLPRRLDVDLHTGRLVGGLPRIRISQVQLSLPAEYSRWCEILELSGQIGAESIEYNPSETGQYTVNLAQVSLSVPLDESEFHGDEARARRLIRLHDVRGRIVFEPRRATLDLLGRLNGSRCRVWGTLDEYQGPLRAMGMDLHVEASNVPLPDRRDPYVADQVNRLARKVRRFFEIFDPHGTVGVAGHLVREAGADKPTKFRGTLTAKGVQARYREFPYQGEDVDATIHFTDEGILFDVLGRRGLACMRLKGWLADATSQTDADVVVDAVSVPLDLHLEQTLPRRFRELWRHFDLFGLVGGRFHIWRTGGSVATGPAPWHWQIALEANQIAARYHGFPYLETGLSGTIEAADGLISRIDLHTARAGMRARITGAADLRGEKPSVDLRLRVRNQELTPPLAQALPVQIRRLLDELSVAGSFDADLVLRHMAETGWKLECRGDLAWRDGSLALRRMPYPFGEVQGRLRVDSGASRIDMLDVRGRNGPATASLSGTILTAGGTSGRFRMAIDGMPLDDRLRDVLPAPYRRWWDDLQLQGRIGVRSEVSLDESRPDGPLEHQTTLLLQDSGMCWRSFPLPLEKVTGRISLGDGRFTLHDLKAAHGSGTLEVSGQVDTRGGETTAAVRLTARDVPLNEDLRMAVPLRLRRLWNDLQPAGQIDLDLPRVEYRHGSEGDGSWDLEGTVRGRLRQMQVPVALRDAVLDLSGSVHIAEGKDWVAGHGRLAIERALVHGIPVSAAQAQWLREPDGSLHVERFRGESLGGTLEGFLQIEPTPMGDRYGLALALNQADLGRLSEVVSQGQMGGVTGTAQAEVRVTGIRGDPASRTGLVQGQLAGQGIYRLPVLLQLAEVLNIPVLGEPRGHQQMTVRATIEGDRALFDTLELRDSSLFLQGGGQADLARRQLDLAVIAARPRSWPKVPLISELLEGTARELIEVHVKGPVNDLVFETRPLRSIQAALQVLLNQNRKP